MPDRFHHNISRSNGDSGRTTPRDFSRDARFNGPETYCDAVSLPVDADSLAFEDGA
jgi:hypothetical protein